MTLCRADTVFNGLKLKVPNLKIRSEIIYCHKHSKRNFYVPGLFLVNVPNLFYQISSVSGQKLKSTCKHSIFNIEIQQCFFW